MVMLIYVIYNWITYEMSYYEYRYQVVYADIEF